MEFSIAYSDSIIATKERMIYLVNDARSCATRRETRDMAQEDHSMEFQVINLVRYIFPRGRCCMQFGRIVFTRPETGTRCILNSTIKWTILLTHNSYATFVSRHAKKQLPVYNIIICNYLVINI